MPVCRTPHSAALALTLLLAGCAATAGDKFNPNPDAAAATIAGVTASAAAVRAFGHLCGQMDEAEVRRRAAAYGFAPVNPNRLPPDVARGGGVRMMNKPGPAPALLIWNDTGPACELAVGGIDTAALIGEFDAMLRILEQRPDVVVNTVPPSADQGGAMRLQRAVMLVPRALVPQPPRALALRTAAPGAIGFQAVMLMREVRPGGAPTPPPPGPGAPKD